MLVADFPVRPSTHYATPPPSFPATETHRYRPIVAVTLVSAHGREYRTNAVLDTGSDECLFPLSAQRFLALPARPEIGYRVTWRGSSFPMTYADVLLRLTDDVTTYRWPATVAFTPAPLKYSLLGIAGCLEYFEARFLGEARVVELEPNWTYPGTK